METPYAKIFGIAGLIFALCGLLFLLEARRLGKFDNLHASPDRESRYTETMGWVFTIVGYLMQIIAVALS
jgi:hypothetical protein